MALRTYQKFDNFCALDADVRMGGYSTAHQSVFLENVWECQLHFRVMYEDEKVQERKSRRQKKKKLKDSKHENTEELPTNMDKLETN